MCISKGPIKNIKKRLSSRGRIRILNILVVNPQKEGERSKCGVGQAVADWCRSRECEWAERKQASDYLTDGRDQHRKSIKSINFSTVLDDMSTCFLHVETFSFQGWPRCRINRLQPKPTMVPTESPLVQRSAMLSLPSLDSLVWSGVLVSSCSILPYLCGHNCLGYRTDDKANADFTLQHKVDDLWS